MKFELKDFHRNVPKEALINDLKRVAGEINKDSITMDEYDVNGKYCSETVRKRMGGWAEALKRAGLKQAKNINISEDDLFANLEEVWGRLGRQPSYAQMRPPVSKFSSHTYQKRFGTWRKALERFVAYINNEENFLYEGTIAKVDPVIKHKTSRTINWRLRFIVMRRDHFKCKGCGRSPATDPMIILHVDHIKAWANGGETVLENLQTLCSVCNIGKSDLA